MHQHGAAESGLVEGLDGFPVEADALVAFEDGREFAAVAAGDAPVALADRQRERA